MKQFFKFSLASFLGSLVVLILFFFLFFGIVGVISSIGKKKDFSVKENTVLKLDFKSPIIDRASDNPFETFDYFSGRPQSMMGLNDVIKNIQKAKADDKIKGIFLDLSFINAGWATIGEIRNALIDFKDSGKFIIAYGEMFTQNAYYLASVADELYLNPVGSIDFRGLNMQVFFLKNMLDKIGVEAQVIRAGDYKSAGEPLMLDSMSDENREQLQSIASTMWNSIVKDISKSRNLSANHLNRVADEYSSRNPVSALDNSMIDGIAHRDEIFDRLRELLEIEKDKEINFASYSEYSRAPLPESMRKKDVTDKIAVVYGMGNIISGEGSETSMGSDRISKAIRKARLDDDVKAIVFRINSGGGSALASDVMLREVILASEEKPVIASFGDIAASGGYYVACAADKIIANPSTITGSIGVFGMIPNMQELFNEKLGINFENVKTNTLADFGSVDRPLTLKEREIMKEFIAEVYDTFISHVSEGRNLPKESVDEIGQGRVWTGYEAMQIGLVDDFGGLNYAIEQAALLAEIDDYIVVEYPIRKSMIDQLLSDFMGVEESLMFENLGNIYKYYMKIKSLKEASGVQARMPFELVIE